MCIEPPMAADTGFDALRSGTSGASRASAAAPMSIFAAETATRLVRAFGSPASILALEDISFTSGTAGSSVASALTSLDPVVSLEPLDDSTMPLADSLEPFLKSGVDEDCTSEVDLRMEPREM